VGGRRSKSRRRIILLPLRSNQWVGCTLVSLWSDAVLEDPLALVKKIHDAKMKAGIAISPDTPSTAITDEIGNAVDMILVMTVYPG